MRPARPKRHDKSRFVAVRNVEIRGHETVQVRMTNQIAVRLSIIVAAMVLFARGGGGLRFVSVLFQALEAPRWLVRGIP